MRQRKWFVSVGAAVLCLITTSAYAGHFTDIKGWNYTPAYFDGVEGHEGTVDGIDINGEVGHPLDVNGPTALCEPSRNWTLDVEVTSGTLPPGLEFGNSWHVQGIPTKRGHWIVTVHAYNFTCESEKYMGFTQQLRFHITGTGDVIQ